MADYEPIFLDGELRFVGEEPQLCDVPTPCCDVDACLPKQGNAGPVYLDRIVLSYTNVGIFDDDEAEALVIFEIHFRALAVNDAPNAVYVYRWEKKVKVLDSNLGDIPKSGSHGGIGGNFSDSPGRPLVSESRRRRIPTPNVSTLEFIDIRGSGYRGPEDDALLVAEGLSPEQLHITVAVAVSLNLERTILEHKWRDLHSDYYAYEKFNSYASTSPGGVEEGAKWYPGGESFCPQFHARTPASFPFTNQVMEFTGIGGGRFNSLDGGPGVTSTVFNGASPLMMMALVSGNGPLAGDYLLSNTGYTENNAGFRMDCALEGNIQGIPPSASINVSGITVSSASYTPTAKPNADVNGPERLLIDDGKLEALVALYNGSFTGSPDWNRGMAGSWIGTRDDIGCGFNFWARTVRLKNPSLTYDLYIQNGGLPEDWYKEWLWEGRIGVSVNEISGEVVTANIEGGIQAAFTSTTLDGVLFPPASSLEVITGGGFYTRDPAWIAQAIKYFSGWVRSGGNHGSPRAIQHYQIEVDSSDTVPVRTILTGPNAGKCDFSAGAPKATVDLRYWGDKAATLNSSNVIARP